MCDRLDHIAGLEPLVNLRVLMLGKNRIRKVELFWQLSFSSTFWIWLYFSTLNFFGNYILLQLFNILIGRWRASLIAQSSLFSTFTAIGMNWTELMDSFDKAFYRKYLSCISGNTGNRYELNWIVFDKALYRKYLLTDGYATQLGQVLSLPWQVAQFAVTISFLNSLRQEQNWQYTTFNSRNNSCKLPKAECMERFVRQSLAKITIRMCASSVLYS